MAGVLTFLTIFVILFEIWYVAAFAAAYNQLRQRALLWPIAQGLALLAAFVYVIVASLRDLPLNGLVMLVLLLLALVCALAWRRGLAQTPQFFKSYPHGTADVLLFRRPAVDLKRRVRTK
jgi:hypothetical protein